MQLSPGTLLDKGAIVRVGLKICTVVKAEWKPAHPSGYIAVHTLTHTHTRKRKYGNTWKTEPATNGKTFECNYAFIDNEVPSQWLVQ